MFDLEDLTRTAALHPLAQACPLVRTCPVSCHTILPRSTSSQSRLCWNIVPQEQELKYEVIKVQESSQILLWIDRLAQVELCQDERVDIVECLKMALFKKEYTVFNNQKPLEIETLT